MSLVIWGARDAMRPEPPVLAFVSWACVAVVGLCWPSLAIVGLRWPALACVGLRWPSLAIVGLHGCREPGFGYRRPGLAVVGHR